MIEKKLRILWYMQYQVSRRLHIQPTACVATPHTLPMNHSELKNQRVGGVQYARGCLIDDLLL